MGFACFPRISDLVTEIWTNFENRFALIVHPTIKTLDLAKTFINSKS